MRSLSFNLLVVHNHAQTPSELASLVDACGSRCVSVSNRQEMDRALAAQDIGAVLVESVEDGAGCLIAHIRQTAANVAVIVTVPSGGVSAGLDAMRAGACDCLELPGTAEDMRRCLREAARWRATRVTSGHNHDGGERDALTSLMGHNAFIDCLAGLRDRCRQRGEVLPLMMLDVDRFGEVNERHSTAFGDHVLRWFSTMLRKVCRSEFVARYQGDRFIVALPGMDARQAVTLVDRCRAIMRDQPIMLDGRAQEIGFSGAIVESTIGFVESEHQLIRRARIVLDQAKQAGGNRVLTWADMIDVRPSVSDMQAIAAPQVAHWIRRSKEQLRGAYLESTAALVAAVEAKDPHMRAHSARVAGLSEIIGKRIGLGGPMLETLRTASLLHDIGKIGVPDAILAKPGSLTRAEFEQVKRHPAIGVEILEKVSSLGRELPIVLHHHERYDGRGYPAGLSGDKIPVGARVLALTDALDAMFSGRIYKIPYDHERVSEELRAAKGKQFDPAITATVLEWLEESAATARSRAATVREWFPHRNATAS